MIDISVTGMSVDYSVTCSQCGDSEEFTVDDGDYYVNEDQCVSALLDSGNLYMWDVDEGICPECLADAEEWEDN